MTKKNFSPLLFLASLGAGGIAIIPFAFFNYVFPHGKGLVNVSQIHGMDISSLYFLLDPIMAIFILLHVLLSIWLFVRLVPWLRTTKYLEFIQNPLENAGILAPFISAAMTMNVLIGPARYFIPTLYNNLQALMLPGFIVWVLIWIFLMRMEIKLLVTSFTKSFDVSKINFGWLLHPFALGMVTVTGTGIAAMAVDVDLANVAAFMSLITGTMGLFLLLVKSIAIFKSHFAAPGLPEKKFLPGMLIVIPNITLYAISAFRLGHYLEHHHAAELGNYYKVVMTGAFAFETWYLLFGLALLFTYFKKNFFKEYQVTQWGLVCPLVAYAVLGSFVYNLFAPIALTQGVVLVTLVLAVVLFFFLLFKMRCCNKAECGKVECA